MTFRTQRLPNAFALPAPAGGPRGRFSGFSLLEVAITGALLAVLVALAMTRWHGYTAHQRLRFGSAQVATDLRSAQERARSERVVYTVAFTAGSSDYAIVRSGGGFNENTRLPDGVAAVGTVTVTFSAFGQPGPAQTILVHNSAGTGTISVNASGGITYLEP
jgi:Tfp pilus assembly protein FimT